MKRASTLLAALVVAFLSILLLGLVTGAFLDPTSSLWAVVGSSVWTPFGPFLLSGGIVALLLALLLRARASRRLGNALAVLAATATAGSAFILGRIGWAAIAAGATFDVPALFTPGRMDHPAPDAVETFRTVEGQALRAAIFRPTPADSPAPVILYVHGGGFMTGSFTETAADLRWFADQGWLVVSVEYRLFAPDRPTWERAAEDVACALVWVGANAGRLGGDPSRLALLGDSAGGNLAVNVGYAAASGRAPAACGTSVPVPDAIATLYPALDPLSIYDRGYPIPGFAPRMLIEGFIGGPPDDHPDRIAAVTAANHLTPAAPPTLIVLPEKDSLVVAEGTLRFADAATRQGIDLTLVRLPFANHVFNQIAAGSLGNQIARTLRLAFLRRHAS